MYRQLIKVCVRFQFLVTSKEKASRQIRDALQQYLTLAEGIEPSSGSKPILVPPMRGVDEDMRNWSFFMLLEHNAIANRNMTAAIRALVTGDQPEWLKNFDIKKDVMPSPNPGMEQVEAFKRSVDDHLAMVEEFDSLRTKRTRRHPIFGELDGQGWHSMFALHLKIHIPQAKCVVSGLRDS